MAALSSLAQLVLGMEPHELADLYRASTAVEQAALEAVFREPALVAMLAAHSPDFAGPAEVATAWWHDGALPWQVQPCLRCRSHERWREVGPCRCEEPDHSWHVWCFVAGRGTGKTLTGAHWSLDKALAQPGTVGAVIAPTHSDLRRVVVEGESGLLAVIPPELIVPTVSGRGWNEAAASVELRNGSVIRTMSAEHPDRIRGENLSWTWADEVAAWTRLETAWDILEFALRKGDAPQVLITTTPRPLALLRAIVAEPGSVVTGASMSDNPHLSPIARARLERRYAGTRVGRQELEGEILDETEGALVTLALIDAARAPAPPRLDRIVVGVDPSGGRAEIGIVVAGRRGDDVWVLEDASLRGTPAGWGAAAVAAYNRHAADRMAVERNFGGDMAEHVIRSTPGGGSVAVTMVTASRGKLVRAEPLASLFEQGRVHMAEVMPELDDQLTTWVPGAGQDSPDRLDALVWAVHELMDDHGPSRAALLAPPVSITRSAPRPG